MSIDFHAPARETKLLVTQRVLSLDRPNQCRKQGFCTPDLARTTQEEQPSIQTRNQGVGTPARDTSAPSANRTQTDTPRIPASLERGEIDEAEATRQFRALTRRACAGHVPAITEYFDTLEWAGFDVGAFIREQIGLSNDE